MTPDQNRFIVLLQLLVAAVKEQLQDQRELNGSRCGARSGRAA
jgi:hypothetical protein